MSSNPALSPTVKRKKVTIDSAVRQHEPKPKKDETYRFSNGRVFTDNPTRNPYTS